MLKLATIIDNPGEPPAETRYRDPVTLRNLGYNGLVIYETTGLSGLTDPDLVTSDEIGQWITQRFDHVSQSIDAANASGLEAYIFYDALVLARDTVERNPEELVCLQHPEHLCPCSDITLNASADALKRLLRQLPPVAGVVLRFGDNDVVRLPHLMGNDLYTPQCPRCSKIGPIQRISRILHRFHDLIVKQLDKRLIARAWNIRPNGMHDSIELAQRLSENLPGDDPADDRFILSFKFTQTDFWRYQPWNVASLQFGPRPILYELQCQREFEAKGGIPNWQAPLWANGPPECSQEALCCGLADAASQANVAGLWAWVRGGGWGGPFVTNENWIDANVFVVPRLADKVETSPSILAREWITTRLNITNPDLIKTLEQVLEHSTEAILNAFYIGPFATGRQDHWHPNAGWIQDDLIDASALWKILQNLPEEELDNTVAEKCKAVELISQDRAALQQHITESSRSSIEPLIHSLNYAESLFETIRDLIAGLVAYRRYRANGDQSQAQRTQQKLLSAQVHWNHHTRQNASQPCSATAYRESQFWELTQQILAEFGQPASLSFANESD